MLFLKFNQVSPQKNTVLTRLHRNINSSFFVIKIIMKESKRQIRKLILRAELCIINNQLSDAQNFNENARELILTNWDEMECEPLLGKVMRQKNEITLLMVKVISDSAQSV